jgi:hypothetical protein
VATQGERAVLLKYTLFFVATYFGTKMIFDLTSYHRYFPWSVFIVIAWALVQAYVLCWAKLGQFFLWHLAIMVAIFVWWLALARRESVVVAETVGSDRATADLSMKSAVNTMFFLALSMIVYLVVFTSGFVLIYNTYYLG